MMPYPPSSLRIIPLSYGCLVEDRLLCLVLIVVDDERRWTFSLSAQTYIKKFR